MIKDAIIGRGTMIWHQANTNLYGCEIGENCNIGFGVEIGPGVKIGNNVRIGFGCFIPEGVTIEDDCNIMPGVYFCNDKYPPSHKDEWGKIIVRKGATIGARCVILPDVEIGEGALVGAASVVTRSIPAGWKAYGHPCRDKHEMVQSSTPATPAFDMFAGMGKALEFDISKINLIDSCSRGT